MKTGSYSLSLALGAGVLALSIVAAGYALADPFPPGGQAQNVEQVGFSALDGRYGGFKIAIRHTAEHINDRFNELIRSLRFLRFAFLAPH